MPMSSNQAALSREEGTGRWVAGGKRRVEAQRMDSIPQTRPPSGAHSLAVMGLEETEKRHTHTQENSGARLGMCRRTKQSNATVNG